MKQLIPYCIPPHPNGVWRIRPVNEQPKLIPTWLTIDLAVIFVSLVIIGVGIAIGIAP